MAPHPNSNTAKLRLTPEVQRVIVRLVRKGHFLTTAAGYCGISSSTVHRWMSLGDKDPESVYGEFARAVLKAEARHEASLLRSARNLAKNDGRFALQYLGRRHAVRWGRHDNLTINEGAEKPGGDESARELIASRFLAALENIRAAKRELAPPTPPADEQSSTH